MSTVIKISVIVSTYESPQYLQLALQSLLNQSDSGYEVIVADDGSGKETKDLVSLLAHDSPIPLFHAWQENKGFRAAAARNEAVRQSTGDYLVFLDGDCIARPSFIAAHARSAEPGYMVRGSRIMLHETLSRQVLAGGEIPRGAWQWVCCRLRGNVKRIGSLMPLPLPFLSYLKKHDWEGVKTCNLGIWRSDFEAVNGFDEAYVGWGHEDADLAVRLLRYGIARKEGRARVPVVHLWHTENNKDQLSDNLGRLQRVLAADHYKVSAGLQQNQ